MSRRSKRLSTHLEVGASMRREPGVRLGRSLQSREPNPPASVEGRVPGLYETGCLNDGSTPTGRRSATGLKVGRRPTLRFSHWSDHRRGSVSGGWQRIRSIRTRTRKRPRPTDSDTDRCPGAGADVGAITLLRAFCWNSVTFRHGIPAKEGAPEGAPCGLMMGADPRTGTWRRPGRSGGCPGDCRDRSRGRGR